MTVEKYQNPTLEQLIAEGGSYTAGDGLTLTGSDFDIDLTDTTIFSDSGAASRAMVTDASAIASATAFKAGPSNHASAGAIRLSNNVGITARDFANTGNIAIIKSDDEDRIVIGDYSHAGAIYMQSANGSLTFNSGGFDMFADGGDVFLRGNTIHVGGSAISFNAAETPSVTQAAAASDVTPANFTIESQAPFATASGTNRKPGDIVLDLGTPTNSGTDNAKVSIKNGGSERLSIGYVSNETTLTSTPAIRISSSSAVYLTGGGAGITCSATGAVNFDSSASTAALSSSGIVNLRPGARRVDMSWRNDGVPRAAYVFPVDTSLSTDSATTIATIAIGTSRPVLVRGSIRIWDASMNVYVSNFSFMAKNISGTVTVWNYVEDYSMSGSLSCTTTATDSSSNAIIQATRPTGVACTASVTYLVEA